MNRTRCAHRRPSSFWKVCMPTAASAAAKNEDSRRKKRGVSRRARKGAANVRTSGASTIETVTLRPGALMKWIRYSKYTGEDLGIGAEDLLQALADFLLES